MTQAFKNLVAALEAGYLESKKQQDHFFKVLNGQNEEVRETVRVAFRAHGEIKLSKEQQEQGRNWLLSLWKSPKTGRERKNNPFNARCQHILRNFYYATLADWYVPVGSYTAYAYPVYRIHSIGADYFDYVCIGGGIKILG